MYTLPKFWRNNKVNLGTSAFSQTLAHFTIYMYIMQDEQVWRLMILYRLDTLQLTQEKEKFSVALSVLLVFQ